MLKGAANESRNFFVVDYKEEEMAAVLHKYLGKFKDKDWLLRNKTKTGWAARAAKNVDLQ